MVFRNDNGEILLKIVFYIALPALVILTLIPKISDLDIQQTHNFIPITLNR